MGALADWLECANAFCNLVGKLDREGVNQAAWNGHKVPDGLHWDGKTYLRAAGVVAERFLGQPNRLYAVGNLNSLKA